MRSTLMRVSAGVLGKSKAVIQSLCIAMRSSSLLRCSYNLPFDVCTSSERFERQPVPLSPIDEESSYVFLAMSTNGDRLTRPSSRDRPFKRDDLISPSASYYYTKKRDVESGDVIVRMSFRSLSLSPSSPAFLRYLGGGGGGSQAKFTFDRRKVQKDVRRRRLRQNGMPRCNAFPHPHRTDVILFPRSRSSTLG